MHLRVSLLRLPQSSWSSKSPIFQDLYSPSCFTAVRHPANLDSSSTPGSAGSAPPRTPWPPGSSRRAAASRTDRRASVQLAARPAQVVSMRSCLASVVIRVSPLARGGIGAKDKGEMVWMGPDVGESQRLALPVRCAVLTVTVVQQRYESRNACGHSRYGFSCQCCP